ncbi:septum site-determining protein Ssd [Kocuria tytonis]|uniref:septum site-determining protein Ssd n=1 Tax=Kocuria tytonis TaxID=2054280 RepID=UPI0018F6049B|nr:septum site-determining protein Ssd [Kocuria tytonis]
MTSAHTLDPGAPPTDSPRRARRAAEIPADQPLPVAAGISDIQHPGAHHGGHQPPATCPPAAGAGAHAWDDPIAPRRHVGHAVSTGELGHPGGRGVRLLTSSPDLAEAVDAVCIGAGAPLTVARENGVAAASSDLVLVDADWRGDGVPPGCVVVALAGNGDAWDAAARFQASAVVVLPHAAAWLAELVSRSTRQTAESSLGRVYGVVGATGGVGASTAACWLAGHFAAQGADTVLVDGDPLGTGLDLVLGEETEDGLRWPELHQFSGAVAADQLWAAMPRVDALRYLSWDRHATHADTVPAATVVSALRGAAAVQVVDLSRAGLARQAPWCDAVVVLAPRTVRGVLAAEHAVLTCGAVPAVTVLAGLNVADVEPRVLAEATGAPCVATLAFDSRVPQHLDDGSVLRRGRISRHAKAVARIADALETAS